MNHKDTDTTINMRPTITPDPEFQQRVDAEDPFVATQSALQSLIDDAPCEYSQGFLAGVFSMRQQLQILTGRSF